jgi:hypothetical protein
MAAIVSCAGDYGLAERLHDFLLSTFPSNLKAISLNEDEVTIQNKELGVKSSAIRGLLGIFQGSSPDLVGYTITEFGNIFTIGIQQNLDSVMPVCEMCGYTARHDSDLGLHKRTHGLISIP